MQNKMGVIIGFAFGVVAFLYLFKLIILDHVPPSDELAPGVVVIMSVLSGFAFAFIGSLIQNRFTKKRNYKM
jgi:hypothetical protein